MSLLGLHFFREETIGHVKRTSDYQTWQDEKGSYHARCLVRFGPYKNGQVHIESVHEKGETKREAIQNVRRKILQTY